MPVIDDINFTVAVDEATAARRRIWFRCVSVFDSVSPLTGLTFAASDIKVGKNFSEVNSTGTVTEIAAGFYYYEFTVSECDTPGNVSIRIEKTGVRAFQQLASAQITGTNEPPAPDPAPGNILRDREYWFDTIPLS